MFVSGAVIWQLFLGGLMSVNSPLTDPVSISCSLSLSHFPPLCLCLLGTTGDICSTSSPPSPSSHTHTQVLGQWLKRLLPQLQPGFSATTQITLSAQETSVCAWRGGTFTVKMVNVIFIALILLLWILSKPFTHQIYMKETLSKDSCENVADEIECEVCAG